MKILKRVPKIAVKTSFKVLEKTKSKRFYKLIPVGEAYWVLQNGNNQFSIESYHPSGDYKGPMKFKKEDAIKLQRFLNFYYTGNNTIFDYQTYSRIKTHLNLKSGLYASELC